MLAFGSNVYAGPTGGVVSAGSASIAGGVGTTTINQASQNVAINWQSFSIGQGESVRFVQPNSSSIALNRVLGSDPSSILGSLSANGKVFLLNPNGILFGQGAQVNVGGLVASTLNISDSDFMAGKYNFSGASTASILNQGSINADGGYVALLGANVSNQGVISAKLGTVALAAGNAMTLDVAGRRTAQCHGEPGRGERAGAERRPDPGRRRTSAADGAGGGDPVAKRSQQHRRDPGADHREPQRHHQAAGRHAKRHGERGRHAGC